MRIGDVEFQGDVGLAPMAGMTDAPMRSRALAAGAGWAVTEMVSANPRLKGTDKSRNRLRFDPSERIRVIQIAGADPAWCADAARYAADAGADIVDINMGCPAKKVCNKAAGSALMRDEPLVARILGAVVAAVEVPVTLKTRAGWDLDHLNAPTIARIAEDAGIAALAIHGRTRACRFGGSVNYALIGEVVAAVAIPVLANGDLTSAEQVARVLASTGAAGCLIGRAAVGNPWLFTEIARHRGLPDAPALPSRAEKWDTIRAHVRELHAFYGAGRGVRIARKHIAAYFGTLGIDREITRAFMGLEDERAQNERLAALAEADGLKSIARAA
mgnify:CR=1 FL=1